MLAQVSHDERHGCSFVHDRAKAMRPDFYEELNSDSRYSDTSFKREDAIFFHDGGFNEINSNLARHQRNGLIHWSRLNDFIDEPSLFGSEGIRPEDV